jgi:hypothetical protein
VLTLAAIEQHQCRCLPVGEPEQLLDELQRRLVRPVQILEEEAEGVLARERLEERRHGLERLPLHGVTAQAAEPLVVRSLEAEPEQRGEKRIHGLGLPVERGGQRGLQLEPQPALGLGGPEAEPATQEVAHRPEGSLRRVRGRVPDEEAHVASDARTRLRHEPALADPGLARDRDDRSQSVFEPTERFDQRRKLWLAADQRALLRDLPLGLAHNSEGCHRLGLALQLQLAERLEREAARELPRSRMADRDTARTGRRLQASGDVHRVAEGVVEDVGRRVQPGNNHGASVDRDPCRQLDPVRGGDVDRVARKRLVNRQRRADGAFSVVAVRGRCTEQCKQAIPSQLGDGSVEAPHLLGHQAHDLVKKELRPLRAEHLRDRGRVDKIGDKHRDDAPLARPAHGRILTAT